MNSWLHAIHTCFDWALLGALFVQFAIISLLAFGGGQAVLPLIERESVGSRHWMTSAEFTASVGFGYLIPGPVTTMAAFVGYMAAGLPGGIVATLGMFLAPTILAGLAAAGVEKLAKSRWVKAFGAGASPAVVGLFGSDALEYRAESRNLLAPGGVALIALALAVKTRVQPIWLLLGGGTLGWLVARL